MTILESIRSGNVSTEKANFVNLVAVALADGHITHEEYDLLYIVGKRFGANAEEVDEIITAYKFLTFEGPSEMDDKLRQLISLNRMMLADGIVDEKELRLINSFASGLGFDESTTAAYIKRISDMVLQDHLDSEILDAIR